MSIVSDIITTHLPGLKSQKHMK